MDRKSKTYKGANNAYYKEGCPALMQDGRFITEYRSSNEITESMRKISGFRSSNEFRVYMQNNGETFMNANREYQNKNNVCYPNVACSEGYYTLWEENGGSWGNITAENYYHGRVQK